MSQKFTMWNIQCDSWEGIPDDLEVSADMEKQVQEALTQLADEKETIAYKTPVDQEQLARIIN